MTPRLKSKLLAQAILRLHDLQNIPAYLRRSGDIDSGALLILVSARGHGCALYSQSYDLEGRRQWLRHGEGWLEPAEAETRIARALSRDPDLWVIEIEDDQDRGLFKLAF